MKPTLWTSIVAAVALPLGVVAGDTNASVVARNLLVVDAPKPCGVTLSSIDLPGSDIGSKLEKDYDYCQDHCKSNRNCKAWTWSDHQGGTCWLKGGIAQGVWKPGAFSGFEYKCEPGVYLTILNCDMPGFDRTNRPGKSYLACKPMGSTFTWSDHNGGTCWLKSAPSPCVYTQNKHSGWLLPS